MTASSKLYEATAANLRDRLDTLLNESERIGFVTAVIGVAVAFRMDNPRFNFTKFYSAVGIGGVE